jgi:hypothetical protein
MKKLIIALALLLLGAVPAAPQAPIVPTTQTTISITGTVATAAVIVTGVTGQRIYVTAVALVPVATSVVTFTQGTGAACGTGTSNVTGAMTFAAGQELNYGSGNGAVFALAPGNSLCITIATAVAPGSLAYAQF